MSAVPVELPSDFVAFVKRDCPTCVLVARVLEQLARRKDLTVFSQDDPSFPEGIAARDDRDLDMSWRCRIETVPTLIRALDRREEARVVGWQRQEWEDLTGVTGLGPELPPWRPGCGSLSVDPNIAPHLRARYEGAALRSRRVELGALDDEMEAGFARGWSDGLPIVPPTPGRVLAMLDGTTRRPDDVVAVVPPDLVECTVEKVAINAVMAGCKPEYLPVVIAAVEAACTDCSTFPSRAATSSSTASSSA
jgi:hypothetical protein